MKSINSILFYFVLSIAILMICNNDSVTINFFGLTIISFEFIMIKNFSKAQIFEITGATWLQKKFKTNRIIMDMTNE